MRPEQEIRSALEGRLTKLLARTGRIASDLRRPGDRDWTERASERANDEVLERLDASEREELRAIRAALARLDDGSYGACERCGASIEPGRLAALPFASACADCAE